MRDDGFWTDTDHPAIVRRWAAAHTLAHLSAELTAFGEEMRVLRDEAAARGDLRWLAGEVARVVTDMRRSAGAWRRSRHLLDTSDPKGLPSGFA